MPVGGGIASGVGSIAGGMVQGKSAKDAAQIQAEAANRATQLQGDMYNQQRSDASPFRGAGLSALYGPGGLFVRTDGGSGLATGNTDAQKQAFIDAKMADWNQKKQATMDMNPMARDQIAQQLGNGDNIRAQAEADWAKQQAASGPNIDSSQYQLDPSLTKSFSMADFQKDPGYDFRMQQGQQALERSAAARGGLQGGGFAKALTQYGQDYASNEYQNAYNRFNNDRTNRFNSLAALAGIGQTSNAQLGNATQNYANNASQNIMGAGNAQGAAAIAGGNAWGGALSNLGNTAMQYGAMNQQNNLNQQWMDLQRQRFNT